jgi:hypothetical protein
MISFISLLAEVRVSIVERVLTRPNGVVVVVVVVAVASSPLA